MPDRHQVLKSEGLLTFRAKRELQRGQKYWRLERKLCAALAEGTLTAADLDDVTAAIELKSFDYRLLNVLLYKVGQACMRAGVRAASEGLLSGCEGRGGREGRGAEMWSICVHMLVYTVRRTSGRLPTIVACNERLFCANL